MPWAGVLPKRKIKGFFDFDACIEHRLIHTPNRDETIVLVKIVSRYIDPEPRK